VGLWTQVKNWLQPIAWACVISILSTDEFSSEHTSRFIMPVLRWLFPRASAQTLDLMHFVIRKAAHFTEYFIFSILIVHGLRGKDRGWKLRWAIWAVIVVAGYASLDEFHQVFVPSRHASPWDALLDATGAAAAQVALRLWYMRKATGTGC
jgi:VanZ family protein